MRNAPLSLLALLVLSSVAAAQTPTDDLADAPVIQDCRKATEVAELRDCVNRLIKLTLAQDRLDEARRGMVVSCMGKQTSEEIRDCLGTVFDPEQNKRRQQRASALEKATRTWEMSESKSRMDNSPSVFLKLESDDEIQSGGGRMRPVLWLRCRENSTNVLIVSEWFIGTSRGVPVIWKAGDDKPVAQTWEPADNNRAAGLWSGDRAIPFIKALLGKNTLIMRVTPYDEGPKEMSFTVEGLDAVVGPLRAACKW